MILYLYGLLHTTTISPKLPFFIAQPSERRPTTSTRTRAQEKEKTRRKQVQGEGRGKEGKTTRGGGGWSEEESANGHGCVPFSPAGSAVYPPRDLRAAEVWDRRGGNLSSRVTGRRELDAEGRGSGLATAQEGVTPKNLSRARGLE